MFKKYKSVISYLVFGVCTTGINIGVYAAFAQVLHVGTIFSTAAAWVIAVLFAWITNKVFVFDSRSFRPAVLIWEMLSFFGCRAGTGAIDVALMYVGVDLLGVNGIFVKTISNIIVIILNYIASKWVVFKKADRE